MTAIKALRSAAKGSETFDEDRALADIEDAIGTYNAEALHALTHKDQLRPRDAVKDLKPILGHLHQLGKRLDKMKDEGWRDWLWIAADAYCERPDVREDLERWNAELTEEFAGTNADLSDYVKTEVDQVGRDLGDLRNIVEKVGPRLQAVCDVMIATKGKGGRPKQFARNAFLRKLRAIYELHTSQRATATVNHVDPGELGAYGPFVDFVVAVNREIRPPLPNAGLGTAIKNFLY